MRNGIHTVALLGVAMGAGLTAGCARDGGGAGSQVTLLDFGATAPAEWQSRPVTNDMRLVEFTVPAPAGAEPAEVVVYYFGEGQGGDVQANIDRWTSQFQDADGGPIMPSVAELSGAAFRTVVADFEGSYGRGIGMGPDRDDAKPDQGLTAAVIVTPSGNLFVQLFGPIASVRAARDGFIDFVSSIHP